MKLISYIALDGLTINGSTFAYAMKLASYSAILGIPDRSEPIGRPAPYGHRNNVIHYYDQLGLFLREHHSTGLIDGIEFVFEPAQCPFPIKLPYSGELTICGVMIEGASPFSDFLRQSKTVFLPHLGHAWYSDGEFMSIQVEVSRPKRKQSQVGEKVLAVSVGFIRNS